jgi:hypothetical protein
MQQDNYIQEKLQQLENNQLPDLSHMEKHWSAMKVQLQPAGAGAGFFNRKNMAYASILALVLLIGSYMVFKTDKNIVDNEDTKHMARSRQTTVPPIIPPSVPANDSTKSTLQKSTLPASQPPLPAIFADINMTELVDSSTNAEEQGFPNPDFLEPESIDRELLLKKLFEDLAKPAETFYINMMRDTLLTCKEGTMIYVPAYAFKTNDVVRVDITEYYDYSDFILNRLTTSSDGKQLISGGMLRIKAYLGDSLINLQKGKQLKAYIRESPEMESMKLFRAGNYTADSLDQFPLNWSLSSIPFASPGLKRFVRAIDFSDENNFIEILEFRRGLKGVFSISRESKLSKAEIRSVMRERYPEYRKMKFKKEMRRNLFFKTIASGYEHGYGVDGYSGLGDTSLYDLSLFNRYKSKVKIIDTVYSTGVMQFLRNGRGTFMIEKDSLKIKAMEKYSCLLDGLGWINCDRFFDYPGDKTDMIVKLGEAGKYYVTAVVFDKFKSALQGAPVSRDKVGFRSLPKGSPVRIISIGIDAAGKPVMAMQRAIIGEPIAPLQFSQQSPEEIKSSMLLLNQ